MPSASRYLARDKSLVPHVIKSFSRSRGSVGKREKEKLFETAGGGKGERKRTPRTSAMRHCAASSATKDEGGREHQEKRR